MLEHTDATMNKVLEPITFVSISHCIYYYNLTPFNDKYCLYYVTAFSSATAYLIGKTLVKELSIVPAVVKYGPASSKLMTHSPKFTLTSNDFRL